MKHPTLVIWSAIMLPVLLLGGANPSGFQEPHRVVWAGEQDLAAAQTVLGVTTRVSVASDGTQGNDTSGGLSLSADGRYVAFFSEASNLVSGDTNGYRDVFIHDRQTGQTTRVSVASDGAQGNNDSNAPFLSADGRYVAFTSSASNLVSGDTNGTHDVFVRDRQTNQTIRVSVATDGTQGNDFTSVFGPSLSADGRYVTFDSDASNLVSGDTNDKVDIFIHDRQTGQTTRVSVASDGTQGNSLSWGPSLSADGRYVTFYSGASNLVSGDTNGADDVFIHDRQTGQTTRVSVASDGTQGNYWSWESSLSADGRYVAFASGASNLVSGDTNGAWDVFVHDRQTGQTTRVSVNSNGTQGNDASRAGSLSADGRYVVFRSEASNLVSGDTNGYEDVFVHDRQTGQTTRVSVASDGVQGNNRSYSSSFSSDGRYVTFDSYASNLVSGDTNGYEDVFVHAFSISVNTSVYLPVVLKPLPTTLYVRNSTTGLVSYTVYSTPEGNITCSNIPPGTTAFCGSFTPGTYNVRVDTIECKSASGQVTFPAGDVTRQVSCGS